ncbi:hypothetical protein [uncultured Amnibacterium sp.]|uniref:hypothetical protein n=1 Tax=uncultured Amnibacterium sp. TaxID=1631851 RepID=UPI0035CB1AD6
MTDLRSTWRTAQEDLPWSERSAEAVRSAVRGAGPWAAGDRARRLEAALALAAITDAAARSSALQTRARERTIWWGNTARSRDDPQHLRLLGEHAGLAAIAVAAADALLAEAAAGTARDEDLDAVLLGLDRVAGIAVTAMFDTLGASATAAGTGLHRLWLAYQEVLVTIDPAPLAVRVGREA